jgi:hypothetical protein
MSTQTRTEAKKKKKRERYNRVKSPQATTYDMKRRSEKEKKKRDYFSEHTLTHQLRQE